MENEIFLPEILKFHAGQTVMLNPEVTIMPDDTLFPELQGKKLEIVSIEQRVNPCIAKETGATSLIHVIVKEGDCKGEVLHFINTTLIPFLDKDD